MQTGNLSGTVTNDAVKAAAVRSNNGRIFTGKNHAEATEKADKAQAVISDDYNEASGFVTYGGEFLSMEKAWERAVQQKQLPESIVKSERAATDALDSPDASVELTAETLNLAGGSVYPISQSSPKAKESAPSGSRLGRTTKTKNTSTNRPKPTGGRQRKE